jgi:hypothetical protein
MKRPFASKRPIGPFAQGPFEADDHTKAVAEFTIEKDSIEIDLREPPVTKRDEALEEVIDLIGPRFDTFDMEETRTGDFKVIVDITKASLDDLAWLEEQIDEAESEGLDIYNVQVNVV